MTAERSDEDLLARVAAGDSMALGTLYDCYGASIYSLALHMLHDRLLAEEVVQEAFVRVWRQAGSYQRERGTPATWMLGIARHLAIDELRRRAARPRPSPGDATEALAQLPSDDDDPADQAVARVRHEVVSRALEQLPRPQREVLELAYFNNLSQTEIAARLGDPLGTVKTRMRLGLQKLKTLLSPDEAGIEAP